MELKVNFMYVYDQQIHINRKMSRLVNQSLQYLAFMEV